MAGLQHYISNVPVAGIDEAGRGCLAGPVYAAAVILPESYSCDILNDSKKMSLSARLSAREKIEKEAIAYSVASVSAEEIDEINILQATYKAMHLAVEGLKLKPGMLLIDGNRFLPMEGIPFETIIKGDGIFYSIAAASVLAKTYRDEFMINAGKEFPDFKWEKNKGYGTKDHVIALDKYGYTPYHRKSFQLKRQLRLDI